MSSKLVLKRHIAEAQFFVEPLAEGVGMDMMLIPARRFVMGSPEEEEGRSRSEGPQHEVSVPSFLMGKYPVTQEQWRAVVALPKVKRQLESDPSEFKGPRRPVERVSWEEAIEFCDRLSERTGREYRLPSEAEWEYACRAGTQTPFHFGETITTDIANYRGTDWEYEGRTYPGNYAAGPKGEHREETTDVDHFDIANGFGLCDMHGNVFEWCLDHWHEKYEDAPDNGSAWIEGGKGNRRVIRGGSWDDDPRGCRSAYRNRFSPDLRDTDLGFRVVCALPRTD